MSTIFKSNNDIGNFNIVYKQDAEKYKYEIEKGINRWYSVGVNGRTLVFTTVSEPQSSWSAIEKNTIITINLPNFENLNKYTQVLVITHEVGHALGIGHWDINQPSKDGVIYLDGYPKTQKVYVEEIRENNDLPGPPLAPLRYGPGSAIVHWSPEVKYGLSRDIMVPVLRNNTNVISIVDLTVLQEMGVKVDLSLAQSLKENYYSVLMEYIYGDEKINHGCGNCDDH